jgi:hypothetical protein
MSEPIFHVYHSLSSCLYLSNKKTPAYNCSRVIRLWWLRWFVMQLAVGTRVRLLLFVTWFRLKKNDGKSSVGCQGLSWFIIMRPVKNVPCWSILPEDQGDSYIFWNVFGSAHVNRYSLCLTIFSAKQQNLLPLDPGNYDQNMHPYLIIYGYEMMAAHLVQNKWLVVGQELDAYPLVNIQQTMENHNFLWENELQIAISIANC